MSVRSILRRPWLASVSCGGMAMLRSVSGRASQVAALCASIAWEDFEGGVITDEPGVTAAFLHDLRSHLPRLLAADGHGSLFAS